MSFPVRKSNYLLWSILYLRAKHWCNNLGGPSKSTIPITRFNFICTIEKKLSKNRKDANFSLRLQLCKMPSPWLLLFLALLLLPLEIASTQPRAILHMFNSWGFSMAKPFISCLGSKGMKETVGRGYSPEKALVRAFAFKWSIWLRCKSKWGGGV